MQCKDPIDYFLILLEEDTMEAIRNTTSIHLYSIEGKNTITINDIHKYIGILFVLDLYPFNQLDHAFGKRGSIYDSKFITDVYNINDFRKMHNHLKMQFGDEMIERTSIKVAMPSSFVSLDEMLRKYLSEFKFKHRLPTKPAKKGIKYFILCCSLLNIPLVSTFHDNQLEDSPNLSKTGNMVYNMVVQMLQQHKVIATDTILFTVNYFNSHRLFVKFKALGVKCVGTFKTNLIPLKDKAEEFVRTTKKQRLDGTIVHCPTCLNARECTTCTLSIMECFALVQMMFV